MRLGLLAFSRLGIILRLYNTYIDGYNETLSDDDYYVQKSD